MQGHPIGRYELLSRSLTTTLIYSVSAEFVERFLRQIPRHGARYMTIVETSLGGLPLQLKSRYGNFV
ncbi:MAG TPA: hypothetical protein VGE93_07675, partial [Bryobacteraceae bacterium]